MRRVAWKTACKAVVIALAMGAPLVLTACGEDEDEIKTTAPKGGGAKAPAGRGKKAGAAGPDVAAVPSGLPPLPVREFRERDFIETDLSRDPFRSFEDIFLSESKGRIRQQRLVIVDNYALDELKLVGIVSRGDAKVLLTDPGGLGHVAKVGDFVGKSEVVHATGSSGADVALNWRIDRIRENDVVFIREDPSHPEIPTSTRIVSLRAPDELILEVKSGTTEDREKYQKREDAPAEGT